MYVLMKLRSSSYFLFLNKKLSAWRIHIRVIAGAWAVLGYIVFDAVIHHERVRYVIRVRAQNNVLLFCY